MTFRKPTSGDERMAGGEHESRGGIPVESKACSVCGQTKALDGFYATGAQCRACKSAINNERQKRQRRENPERRQAMAEQRARYDRQPAARERAQRRADQRTQPGTPPWARQRLQIAVRTRRVVKPDACEACGSVPPRHQLHGHHWHSDYAGRPLEVRWLCTLCHGAEHTHDGGTNAWPTAA